MLSNLTGWHALLILAIVLLVFGSAKLPALAKSVGQSMRILKDEVRDGSEQQATHPTYAAAPATAATPVTANPVTVTTDATAADQVAARRAS